MKVSDHLVGQTPQVSPQQESVINDEVHSGQGEDSTAACLRWRDIPATIGSEHGNTFSVCLLFTTCDRSQPALSGKGQVINVLGFVGQTASVWIL